MALILEVLDPRTGEVRLRRRLDGGEVTIGRGYANDVVLDDPYADARHARIAFDETGAPVIEDLGSVNALVAPDRSRQNRIRLFPEMEVRVGRTRLRFRDADAPVPPALPDPAPSGGRRLPGWVGTWWGQLALTAAATAGVAWLSWLGNYTSSPASEVVSAALAFLIVAALWSGIWAVASRVVVQRFRFLGHLAVVSALSLAAMVLIVAQEWATFLFPDGGWIGPLETALVLLLAATLVAGQLSLSSTLSARRRWTAGLVTGVVLLAITGVVTLAEDDSFSDVPAFPAMLKPFPAGWLPTRPVERLSEVAEDLKREVDALAAVDR